jgi:hypothetical protein
MAGGMPEWHVFHADHTTPPQWLLHNAQPEAATWWMGFLVNLVDLLDRVPNLPENELTNFRNGTNIESHPTHPEFWTRCLVPTTSGPPPQGQDLEVCHICENRMCLAPWHLVWSQHEDNIKGGLVHKRNRHRYHPYEAAQ